MFSVTQKVWHGFLKMGDIEPPKINKNQDSNCWLCGGGLSEKSWSIKDAITSSFTDASLASCNRSNSVCCACVALMKKESWVDACNKHGHSPYFPIKDGKDPYLSNWMFSSHIFSNKEWLMPSRADLELALLDPPEPPFAIVIAESGKKHLIFRAKISQSKDNFFVQFEEQCLSVNLDKFKLLHKVVKEAYNLGLSKDSILTGKYNYAALLKIGLTKFNELENELSKFRKVDNKLLALSCFVAQKSEV